MKNNKMLITLMLSICLLATVFGIISVAEGDAAFGTLIDTYDIGSGGTVTAYLYQNNEEYTLYISGDGAMSDFKSTTIPWNAYKDLITTAIVGDGVTNLGSYCFYRLTALSEVKIADTVTDIGKSVFNGCKKGAIINIPASVTSFGSSCFGSCGNLIIKYGGSIADWCAISFPSSYTAQPLYYADEFYVKGEPVSELYIPDSVKEINQYCFYGYGGFSSISIPASTEISTNVFGKYSSSSKIESFTVRAAADSTTEINYSLLPLFCNESFGQDRIKKIIDFTDVRLELGDADLAVLSEEGYAALSSHSERTENGAFITWDFDIDILNESGSSLFSANPCSSLAVFSVGRGLSEVTVTHNGEEFDGFTYDSDSGDVTVPSCPLGSFKVSAKSSEAPVISGVSLNLDQDIDIIYKASVPELYTVEKMSFDFNGRTYDVTDFTEQGGIYEFRFTGVMPYQMGDNISATLHTKDSLGNACSYTHSTMSVRGYYELVLINRPNDTALLTLLSDMLMYGERAQTYNGYKTDALVTEGLALTPSNYSKPESVFSLEYAQGANAKLSGAGLYCTENMGIYFNATAENEAGKTVRVSINNRSEEHPLSTLSKNSDGQYELIFDGIMAYEFGDTITVELIDEGTVICIATYSVNSYINIADESSDTNLKELVRAIFCYGNSAKAYKG